MPDFRKHFTISGSVVIKDVESADEADAVFASEYDESDLANIGVLETDPAVLEKAKPRSDHASKVRDVYIEQLRQDMAEEQRHG